MWPVLEKSLIVNNPRPQEVVLSPDQYLVEQLYNYQWTPERAAEAWAVEYQRFGRLILEQKAGF